MWQCTIRRFSAKLRSGINRPSVSSGSTSSESRSIFMIRLRRAVMVGPPVRSVAPRRSGGLVAATSEGTSLLTPDGSLDPLVRMAFDTRRLRMNDGKCDALGRYWTGTMALDHVTPDSSQGRSRTESDDDVDGRRIWWS